MKKLSFAFTALGFAGAAAIGMHLLAGPRPAESVSANRLDRAEREPRSVGGAEGPRTHRIAAEGRVVSYPGAEVLVGTDFAGTLTHLAVFEKSLVKKGDLIAELNADAEKAALAEARARIQEAEADIRLAEFEVSRAEHLVATKVGTQQALDKTQRDRDAARARLATAEAVAKRLAAQVAKARITAPIGGVVLARHVEEGETVERGARLVTIADLDRVRVEAEVDESDSERIRLGAQVSVRPEGERAGSFRGRVEEIPDAVTARRTKPQDPGKPSDTRVLLVKIALSEKTSLKLGRRVEVEIEGTR